MLFTVVAVVVTGSTLASSPSRCHSRCLYQSLGRSSLFTCSVKAEVRRRLAHSLCPNVQNNRHSSHLASHACSCKFTLLPVVARRTCDVSSKRLAHPPLASMRAILTDGSRAPPSAWTSPCVASLVQVTPDIQPHRSVALLLLPKTTLVLGPMSLFLTITLLPWHSMAAPRWQMLLFPCTASSALVPLSLCSNEGLCWLMLASHSED